ncbi:MAG: hypothetical protein OXG78_01595 [Chloroflexi bacterium]|nr:hypothetical protein [Chloroflexota bacterium]
MPQTSLEKLNSLPFDALLLMLLDYFRPALEWQAVSLSADEARGIAAALAEGRRCRSASPLVAAVAEMVETQLRLLRDRWGLDLAGALRADMSDIGPWTTTAEYIEVANIKTEAETQIVLGAALLAAAGRREYADYLIDAVECADGDSDVDAAIARRVLLELRGIDGAS